MKINVEFKDLVYIYENLSKGIKNKKSIYNFEKNKIINLYYVKHLLENNYDGGKYNVFLLKYPKKRIIMSQSIVDKIINHYITYFYLQTKLNKYLDKRNVATRKNMGTSYGINLFKEYINRLKYKYSELYVLKVDIKNYFPSISHKKLKDLLKGKLDSTKYNIICKVIDSTNRDYINEKIKIINTINNLDMPLYKTSNGLPIGNMTSQILGIFYLHKLHFKLIHKYKIKYYVNYMDDYWVIHHDKEYLKKILKSIRVFLSDYDLEVNENKTNIVSLNQGVNFPGYRFILNSDKRLIIKFSKSCKKNIKSNLKTKKWLYENKKIDIIKYFNTYSVYKNSFKYVKKKKINELIEKII